MLPLQAGPLKFGWSISLGTHSSAPFAHVPHAHLDDVLIEGGKLLAQRKTRRLVAFDLAKFAPPCRFQSRPELTADGCW